MAYLLSLDLYKVVFLAEIAAAEGIFVFRLGRRRLFVLRLILMAAACFTLVYFMPVFSYGPAMTSAIFFAVFLLSVGALFFCFRAGAADILFCSVAAYSTQHLAYQLLNFVLFSTGLLESPASAYGSSMPENISLIYVPIWLVTYFIVYAAVGVCMKFILPDSGGMRVKSKSMLGLVFVVLAVDIVANAIAVYADGGGASRAYALASSISGIGVCAMTLWVLCAVVARRELKDELDSIYRLYRQEQRHYETTQSNIDLINRKCHDLKYQIRAIAESGKVGERVIGDIERAISVYDSTVNTGNKTLDVLLTEKSLLCRDNDISFTCVADGSKLDFINEVDLFTLFGNALDNALEAVMRVDKSRRIVGLTIKSEGGLVSVTLNNYFDGNIDLSGGLPKTTKEDAALHGYGVRSIKDIVEKYGGDMYISTKGGIFSLNILFMPPAPQARQNA